MIRRNQITSIHQVFRITEKFKNKNPEKLSNNNSSYQSSDNPGRGSIGIDMPFDILSY